MSFQSSIARQGVQGPAGLTPRGAWSALATYLKRDVVIYDGENYVALKTSNNVTPGSDDTAWAVLPVKESDGVESFVALAGSPATQSRLFARRYDANTPASGAWYREVADEPAHALKQPRDAGGWWEIDETQPDVSVAGVREDASAAVNSAAFARFETYAKGRAVDLKGRTFTVSSRPTGCRYYNGDFIVGSDKIGLRRRRLGHPLDGQMWSGLGDGITHFWMNGIAQADNGVGIAIVKVSAAHAASGASELRAYRSDDRFLSLKDGRTIGNYGNYDIAASIAGRMANGRIGVLVRVRDNSIPDYRNHFVYTDDTESWAEVSDVLTGTNEVFGFGEIVDTGTHFVVAGYRGTGVTKIAYTTYASNGAAWASYDLFAGDYFAEPWLIKLPGEDKYIMFLRKDGGNLHIATCTDPTDPSTWSQATNTGVALGSNPVSALIDGGRLYVYLMMRDFDPSLGEQNEMLMIEDDPAYVFENRTFSTGALQHVADLPDRALGYFVHTRFGDEFVWGFNAGERDTTTTRPAASAVYFGSTRRVALASPAYARRNATRKSLLRNPTFNNWTRGTTLEDLTDTAKICDGWAIAASGATIDVSRIAVPVDVAQMLPFGGRYGLHVESTEDDYINLYQDIKGDDFWRLAGKPVTVQIWGRGPLPTGARLSVVTNYGSGGSTLSDTFTVIRAVSGSDKLWHASATLQTGTPVGKTIGTTPYHRVQFISPSLATWDVDIFGIFAEVGDTPSRFEGVDFDEDRVRCRRRLKTLDFAGFDQLIDGMAVGTTGFWGTLTWTEMAAAPVISLKTGAASDLRIYTDEIDGTDVVFERRMPDRCSLRLTAAGLTANKPGILRVKSGSNVSLLLDAE